MADACAARPFCQRSACAEVAPVDRICGDHGQRRVKTEQTAVGDINRIVSEVE